MQDGVPWWYEELADIVFTVPTPIKYPPERDTFHTSRNPRPLKAKPRIECPGLRRMQV